MLHDVMMTNELKREGVTDLVTGRKLYCRSFSEASPASQRSDGEADSCRAENKF